MFQINRKFTFDAAHRIIGHESKCKNLHGHRYVAEIICSPIQTLDNLGRVIDFGVIKSVVGKWIDDYWDHNTILHPRDLMGVAINNKQNYDTFDLAIPGKTENDADEELNPTAENMARFLFLKATELLEGHNISVDEVILHETENCKASYKKDFVIIQTQTNLQPEEMSVEEMNALKRLIEESLKNAPKGFVVK